MKKRFIALMADDTPSLVIGMLGILGAGNCFVPINPVFPDERIHFVINDCNISILLTDKSHYGRAQQIAAENHLIEHVLCIDNINETPAATQPLISNNKKEVTPDLPCYVIYTSGSTGKPKGVQISHRNLMPLLGWSRDYFKFNATCRVLQNLSYTFDFGLFEIITTLIFGGTLYFLNKEQIRDFNAYVDFIHKRRINTIHTTPSFFSSIATPGGTMPTLRTVHLGGERLTGRLVDEFSKLLPGNCTIHNGYGPTEATINASIFSLKASGAGALHTRDSVPIGKPSANNILYILDKYNRLQPGGAAGELCIAGPGLASGYLNNPELTAERFICPEPRSKDLGCQMQIPVREIESHALCTVRQERIYRTGDLARWLPDGNIDFLGRIDHQVKIRGFRIELGEIENCLLSHPRIKDAVVMAAEGEKRETAYLCAYIVPGTGLAEIGTPGENHPESFWQLSVSVIRNYLAETLPDYMIPAYFVLLDRMPLTTSGKVDRKALPEPDEHSIMKASDYAPPANEIEEKLAAIWRDILGIERIGRESDFFELGGDSILANQCIARIRVEFHLDLSLRKIFEHPTIKALSKKLANPDREIPGLIKTKAPRGEKIPLSFAQERLWFLQELDAESAAYFVPRVIRMKGRLEKELLERTFTEIIRRHEILRTVFVLDTGKPVQQVQEPYDFSIPVIDMSGLGNSRQAILVEDWISKEGRRSFDFEKGPLLRVTLLKLNETEHLFVLTEHHLIHDGWTQGVLLKEFITIFSAYWQGRNHNLPELPIQYADFALWQRTYMQGERLQRHLAYWKEKLSGLIPVLGLPVDRPRPPVISGQGNLKRFSLSTSLSKRLKEFSRTNEVTLFMTMLAVFKTLLFRYTGEGDLCVGTGIANRRHKEMEGMLGMVINTLPLRTRLTGDIAFADCLNRVKNTCLEAYQNQDTPFAQIVNALSPERSLSYTPIFQVLFSFMDTPGEDLVLPGLELHLEHTHNRSSKFDIFYMVIPPAGSDREDGGGENPGEILVELEYNTDIFNEDTMDRMFGHYVRLLELVTANPGESVYGLPMLTPAEMARLLVEFNNTKALYPNEKTIHGLFEEQVERTPGHIASSGPTLGPVPQLFLQISYRELNEKSNRLAYWLREKKVGPDTLVGIMVEHSVEMIIGILGILKSGGAYMPIDPVYPQKRIDFMLKDSGAGIIVENHHARGTDQPPVIRNPQPPVIPSNLAYIIYTSGTTGRPKGVMIPHRGLVNYSWWAAQSYIKDGPMNFPLYSSLSFDLTVTSIFTPLITGGAVIVYTADQPSFLIEKIIADNKVGVIKLTPSHLKLMTQMNNNSYLQRLIVGGEALETQLASDIDEKFRGRVEIFNEYGPTETVVGCMLHRFDPLIDNGKNVPLGRPAHNVQIYVLDKNYNPLPYGVTGELFIAGDGVARGYLNRPELTAERFFPRRPGEYFLKKRPPGTSAKYFLSGGTGGKVPLLYRSGDLARFRPDGNIEFLGRKDHQVKIRGHRVELAEIETLLRDYKFTPKGLKVTPGNIQNTRALEAVTRCRQCVLSANYPGITFNRDGVCKVCEEYRRYESHLKKYFKTGKDFLSLVKSVKNTDAAGKYDCLLLFSGGKDSSYVLYRLVELGLKVLTFTFDNGYISETAFTNIKRIASQLAVDNIVAKAEHMDRVFVESLRTNHNVCHGCWNALNGLGIKVAEENHIPMVISGLSRGQIFDMRLHGLFQVGIFAEEEIQKRLQLFRKTYHSRENKFSDLLDIQLPGDAIEAIQFVDFFRYDDTPVQHIKRYLAEHGWVQPADTGFCSSNCVINDVGIFMHLKEEGYHFYEAPLSWDCRLGVITREEGLREMGFEGNAGDIEGILHRIGYYTPSAVTDAVVVDKEDKYLCAYLVSEQRIDEESLRAHLREELPDYMIPRYFIRLEKIPLTRNGKVDRDALPEPGLRINTADFNAPRDPLESQLAEIWSEVLAIDTHQIGVNANFFRLGGHSLSATTLVAKIQEVFQVNIPLAEIFKKKTLQGLADSIKESEKEHFTPIEPVEKKEFYPLSSAQKRLYILHQVDPGSTVYNVPMLIPAPASTGRNRLPGIFQSLLDRHESFRTSFHEVNDEPVQRIHDHADFEIQYFRSSARRNWRLVKEAEWEEEEYSEVGEDSENAVGTADIIHHFTRPFDLEKAPLLRVGVVKTGGGEFLVLDLHHIISDGISSLILEQEFSALVKGEGLPALQTQYKDFSLWQNNGQEKEHLKEQEKFWLNEYKGEIPVLDLPTDYARPATQDFEGDTLSFNLSTAETAALKELALEEGVTFFMVLLALYNVLLAKISGQEEVIIGTPIAGRRHVDLEQVVGMFVNTLVLRNFPCDGKPFRGFLQEVKEGALKALENQDYQFEDLVEHVGVTRDPSRNPLFDVMLVLQNMGAVDGRLSRLKSLPQADLQERTRRTAKFDLTLLGAEEGGRICFHFEYATRLFKRSTIERFNTYFKRIISQVPGDKEKPLSAIDILVDSERSQLLVDFNQTATPYPGGKTLHQLFAEQVGQTPSAAAAVYENKHITYHRLNRQANHLAAALREKGLTPGVVVGLMVEQSLVRLVSILGILKAGAAYLPLELKFPAERIKYMCTDSSVRIMVTQSTFSRQFDYLDHVLLTDELEHDRGTTVNPEPVTISGNGAYVIYTSGTTGKPKGIFTTHANAVRVVRDTNYIDIKSSDRMLQLSNYAFDGSVFDIYGALLNGAVLVLVPQAEASDAGKLGERIRDEQITVFFVTTALFNALVDTASSCLPGIRRVLFGGERVSVEHTRKALQLLGPGKVLHVYGPTETTVYATCYRVDRVEAQALTIPIGSPIANTTTYILSRDLEAVPVGITGELYIGGAGMAPGYLNNPLLTEEKFVKNPFCPGKRFYKSGDLARWLPAGNIEFLGRIDQQVKIRGFRIELAEIEKLLLGHASIDEAVVIDIEPASGDRLLCAYLVSAAIGPAEPRIRELRDYLSRELPAYMIPTWFVFIDEIPLNSSGKLNRRALPKPGTEDSGEVYEAPRDETEHKLAAIWAGILGLEKEKIGIADNFFFLGGHSLKATLLVSKIHKAFDIKVPLREIFRTPSIKGIAEYIKHNGPGTAAADTYRNIKPAQPKAHYPLSSGQKRLYILHQMAVSATGYNVTAVIVIEGDTDKDRLEKTFTRLIRRHESLRTSFETVALEPVQKINPAVSFDIEYYEAVDTSEEQEIIDYFIRPFDLAQAPLLRVGLVKIEPKKHLLMMDIHHIISDGISLEILTRECIALYMGNPLPPLNIQYKDYSEWQNSEVEKERLLQQELYWLKEFTGDIPELDLPTDHPRPVVMSFAGSSVRFEVGIAQTAALKQIAAEEDVTFFMVLLSTYFILLSRLSGQEDVVVGTPVSGRRHADLDNIIGMFVNTLALRNEPVGGKPYQVFLREVKERALEAFENQEYPFEDLVDKVVREKDTSRNPIFNAMFVLNKKEIREEEYPESLEIKNYQLESHTSKFDLNLMGLETDNHASFVLEYGTRLFERRTIEAFTGYFQAILRAIIENRHRNLADIEILTRETREQILYRFNDTQTPYGQDKTLHRLFEEQVEKTPDRIAVTEGTKVLNYRQLNEKSNQLARALRERGVDNTSLVGVVIDRSIPMVMAVMAILKAGGAYVPLEPFLPEARISRILSSLEVACLLTNHLQLEKIANIAEQLPLLRHIFCLDREAGKKAAPGSQLEDQEHISHDRWGTNPVTNLEPLARSIDPAYIIFTSGSTGVPKGVVEPHRPVINIIQWVNKTIDAQPTDKVLFITSLSFDLSVYDIFGILAAGAAIRVVAGDDIKSPERLLDIMFSEDITLWDSAPAALQQLMPFLKDSAGVRKPKRTSRLRFVMLSGDWIPVTMPDLLKEAFPGVHVLGMGGATEATIWSNYYLIGEVDPAWTSIPYGKPTQNSRYDILDKYLNVCPIGVPGDLFIGGQCLAMGYINDPVLTAIKFIPNPFITNERMYRTGDMARRFPDGNIEFLGRKDHQVKIRGYRIELGEIQGQLLAHDYITDAVVLARGEKRDEKYLCAYYVAPSPGNGGAAVVDTTQLKEFLAKELPDYMIPSYFVQLDKVPVTANGKLDRQALPEPLQEGLSRRYTAPRDKMEQRMVDTWSEILGIPANTIGIDADFFELGGHSLKGTILVARLRKELAAPIPLTQIFASSTIRELADFVRSAGKQAHEEIKALEKRHYYPQSSAQKRLFFLETFENLGVSYNMPIVYEVTGMLDKGRLKRAFSQLIRRHETLRTSFALRENEPVQVVHHQVDFEIEEIHLENANPRAAEMENRIDAFIRPFDLGRAPLLRVTLITVKPHHHFLLTDIHHSISDGTSQGILIKEFIKLYEGSVLPPLQIQYRDFSLWQNHLFETGRIKEQVEYWLNLYSGDIPVLNFPYDFPRPTTLSYEGDKYLFRLEAEQTTRLKALCLSHDVTLYMALLAAFYLLLYKYTGQEAMIVGGGIMGRPHADLQHIIGFFVNLLALRNFPAGKKSFRQFLQEVRKSSLEAYENQDVQFEMLVDKLKLDRDPGRFPLFDTFFIFQNFDKADNGESQKELLFAPYPYKREITLLDLSLIGAEEGDGIAFTIVYSTALFKRNTIETFAERYREVLDQVLQDDALPLKDFKISHHLSALKRKITDMDEAPFGL